MLKTWDEGCSVAKATFNHSTGVNSGTSRASTLVRVNEQSTHKHAGHHQFSVSLRIPVCDWVTLRRRADNGLKSNLN
jgi:hypothetical protein